MTSTRSKRVHYEARATRHMQQILKIVTHYTNSDGRTLSEPFLRLPSKRELPDYYVLIKRPMDLRKMRRRIEDGRYKDFSDMERDFIQLCENARLYNEDTSLIYEDSIELQAVFSNARVKVLEEETDDGELTNKGFYSKY